jgi:hypothetical protein
MAGKPIPIDRERRQRRMPDNSASLMRLAKWHREAADALEREATLLARQERWRNAGKAAIDEVLP